MPEHESQIKTIAAQPQKRKRHQVEEQEALSIMPATAMAMPQSQGKSTAGNSDKAKAYLVDYLAKNSKSDVVAKAPEEPGKYKTPVATEALAPVADKEEAAPETKPQKFLDPAKTDKVVAQKLKKAGHLAKASATTKTAAAKIAESEQAQDKPEAEQHSDSNEGQVVGYAAQPVADKTKAQSQKALHSAIASVIPKTLGDIKDFKEDGKAKHISNAVSTQVSGDVGSVKQSFGGIGKAPPPAPAEKGKELPQPENAETVEALNMGAGVIPNIEPQHLDTKDYLKQNDDLLAKEELPQEHLDMVDTGDLAQANKERNKLKADAVAEPQAVKEAAATEHKQLNTDMHAEEKQARSHMGQHRSGRLKETGEKQKATKTKLEKEREAVAKTINDKYETCQKNIIGKLDKLEKDSLARFDKGQAKATVDFENQVNKDIAEFKRKRYDEVGYLKRKYRQARDWLLGIDDFPEVGKAFDDARKVFENTIDGLIGEITADNNKVIAECKKELADCKTEIAKYVKGLKGNLKAAGQTAMKEVGEKLKALDAEIDKRKEKLQQQLADKRAAAMKAIDQKIEKMKEKLSGALSIIGKLLLEALKKFFKWALEKLGIDAEGFFNTLSKMGSAIKAMFKSPGKFFSNLIDSVKGAITDFKTNFTTYLTGALFDWLTGAVGSIITLPKVFDVKGVLSVILQLAGISWAFIRSKLVNIFGEQKVAYAEKTVDVVKKFVTEGIMGIWDWIKDSAQSLMSTVIEAMKGWLLTKLVVSFAEWIASLLIPGGAILRLVQGIYKLVMWFVDNIQRIIRWVNAVLDSLGNIAMGAISAAIGFIVGAMKIIIPVILDFFAKLLNISGIVDAVKNIINKIVGPIHKAIDKMVDWLKAILNKVVDKVKGAFGKKEEKKPAEKEQRSQEQMQKDLNSGVSEATSYLKSGGSKKKADINKQFNEIESKYGLTDLAVVTDKHNETEKDVVHVHGKVNPEKDGEKVEVELEEVTSELAIGTNQKKFGLLLSHSITNRNGTLKGTGSKLAKNLADDFPQGTRSDYQAHHIIATSIANNSATVDDSSIMEAAAETGYNINRTQNGVYLPKTLELAERVGRPAHTGKHIDKYFNTVRDSLQRVQIEAEKAKSENKPWTEEILLSKISNVENNLRGRLMDMKDLMKLQHDDKLKPIDPHPNKPTF